jgi:hypothetical protein
MLHAFFETYRLFLACPHPEAQSIRFDVRAETSTGKWCSVCGHVCIDEVWYPPSIVRVLKGREAVFFEFVGKIANECTEGSEAAAELENALSQLEASADRVAGYDRTDDIGRLAAQIKLVANGIGHFFHEAKQMLGRLGQQCAITPVGAEGRALALPALVGPDTERPLPDDGDDDPDPESATKPASPSATVLRSAS